MRRSAGILMFRHSGRKPMVLLVHRFGSDKWHRYRFTASMADLERCYDEQASKLRSAFVAEVAALYQGEAA